MSSTAGLDIDTLSDEEALELLHDWDIWARGKQREPKGDWRVWLILSGRGWGKTKTGAEWVRAQVESRKCGRLALVGRTAADVRDVMVEGESGILATAHPQRRPKYEPSKRRVTWPNGAIATTYSAEEPDALRGPQHDGFFADEPAAWKYATETWDNLMFGLRLGRNPRGIATTTPKPTKLIKELVKAATTHVTRGTSYENKANLPPAFFEQIIRKYEGTRLGRQEILAEILEDVEGALWTSSLIEAYRVTRHPPLMRIGIGVDPSVTSNASSAETGIIVAGLAENGHAYILDDLSLQDSPERWAKKVIQGYHRHEADFVTAEVNQGGDLIETVVRMLDDTINYQPVRATRGKYLRAEPIASLYERGLVHHVGTHPDLEQQMCSWVQGEKSPDRLDGLVHVLTQLMLQNSIPLRDDPLPEEQPEPDLMAVVRSHMADPFAYYDSIYGGI